MTATARESEARYLLCRPHGGLNDSLATINTCWDAAQRTGRVLVIDTSRSSFVSRLDDYFELREPSPTVVLGLSRRVVATLNGLDCAPAGITGRLDTYRVGIQLHETISHLEWRRPVDADSGALLHVDLSLDHPEPLVVHEVYSGAPGSIEMLGRLRLRPWVRRRVRRRLRRVPAGGYVGVHIRHSDLLTDYESFLAERADSLAGRAVLVCSDDGDVLRRAPGLLPRSTVVSVSDVPPSHGVPYQTDFHPSRRARRQLAVDTLADLIALGGADEVIYPAIVNCDATSSGFSRLAADMCERREIIDGLLARR